MSTNIYVIRTRRLHWGKYSGINQFLKYIDYEKFHVEEHVVADGDDDFPIKNRVLRKCLRYLVQRKGMGYYKLSDLRAEIVAFWKCRNNKFDILHYIDGEHSAQYLPQVFGKSKRFLTKFIATYHQPPEVLGSLVNKKVLSKLDHVIVVSPIQLPFFHELLPRERISLILHGIDTDFFCPNSHLKDSHKFSCITVGHWLRNFGILRQIADILSGQKDIEFCVVSSRLTGPQQIKLEDLKNVKLYRDNVDDSRLLDLYRQSHVLLLPLSQSTANNALLEGMACGLPAITNDLPSLKAYLSDKEAIFVKDNDPKQFADAVLYLAHHPEVLKGMADQARKRAEALDWRNIAPKYEELYSRYGSNN
ncbi:hypothetical protein AC481_00860 [miscellaneous Crenarchaeota group archaeon SMTZ-80]|nr:MAG: hypothetical protein AC481_00860 [miscellaneous Crenarchaeota group archaeon SMTZ-80]